MFRATIRFNWRVVALIYLACWISLDMIWQNGLLHQLADTYRTFSGKNTQQRLAVGPDANLYHFVSQVKPLLEPKDTRVFVSSADEYVGQRGAYFLYPFNVYWSEPTAVFPGAASLRSGDYIVLIKPSNTRFYPVQKTLLVPGCCILDSELVYTDPVGSVVRVK